MGSQPGQGTPAALLGTRHQERSPFLHLRSRLCSKSGNSPSETPLCSVQLGKFGGRKLFQRWQVLPGSSRRLDGISCIRTLAETRFGRGGEPGGARSAPSSRECCSREGLSIHGKAVLRQPGHGAGPTCLMAGGQGKRHGT